MTAGRRPDLAEVQDAKGNPGKRARRTLPSLPDAGGVQPTRKLNAPAARIWQNIAPELERMNLLRPTDAPALSRYCETLAAYWEISDKVRKLGTTYETESAHGKMRRISPEFAVQERLFNRLTAMEDRFGLTPAARQQVLLRMAGTQGHLPLTQPRSAQDPASPAEPETPQATPIGLLN